MPSALIKRRVAYGFFAGDVEDFGALGTGGAAADGAADCTGAGGATLTAGDGAATDVGGAGFAESGTLSERSSRVASIVTTLSRYWVRIVSHTRRASSI